MLAYEIPMDACDEYCRLSEAAAFEAMKQFVIAIRGCFKGTYLKQPTYFDVVKQVIINGE